jgi:hypothetical protein
VLTPSEALDVTLHMHRLEKKRAAARDALDPVLSEFDDDLCDGSTADMLSQHYVSPDYMLEYAGAEVGGVIVQGKGSCPQCLEVRHPDGTQAAAWRDRVFG